MRRWALPTLFSLTLALPVLSSATARADEDDDLQRQIDTQKSGVSDLEHLDTRKSAVAEIQRLKDWLNQAWTLRSKHEPDQAREVIERCLSQAELVRHTITADQIKADVEAGETKLAHTRNEIQQKKKALQDAQVKKRALGGQMGSGS